MTNDLHERVDPPDADNEVGKLKLRIVDLEATIAAKDKGLRACRDLIRSLPQGAWGENSDGFLRDEVVERITKLLSLTL